MCKLWVVPTPIGNLEDITLRALRVLREVDMVLAEDTRTTHVLLRHYEILKPLRAFHLHNEHRACQAIAARIHAGETAALVSDAGTPGIADPGFLLIRRCLELGIEVECLPGASAILPALVQSGFPTDRFVFEGFLPPKKGRQKRLEALVAEERTVVLYESPHRLRKLLQELRQHYGAGRWASIVREMSKVHAETLRGPVSALQAHFEANAPRGEFVIIISPVAYAGNQTPSAASQCEDQSGASR